MADKISPKLNGVQYVNGADFYLEVHNAILREYNLLAQELLSELKQLREKEKELTAN